MNGTDPGGPNMPCPKPSPSLERQQVPERDRPLGGHGVVERAVSPGQHPPRSELGQELVDRVVEPEHALLDQDEGGDGGDRLRHRRDAEDRVRLGPARRLQLRLAVPRQQRHHLGRLSALDRPGQQVGHPAEPRLREPAHRSTPFSLKRTLLLLLVDHHDVRLGQRRAELADRERVLGHQHPGRPRTASRPPATGRTAPCPPPPTGSRPGSAGSARPGSRRGGGPRPSARPARPRPHPRPSRARWRTPTAAAGR